MITPEVHRSCRIKRRFAGIVLLCFCAGWFVPVGYGQADQVSRLIAALKDADMGVRGGAAEALGGIGAPAVEPLLAVLKDRDTRVRDSAANVLGGIKDPRAVGPLIAALKDADAHVRWGAVVALGQIKDPRAVEPLIAALKDAEAWVRPHAAEALGRIKGPRAINALLAGLRKRDLLVIAGAYSFFIERGEPGSEDVLIRALNAVGSAEMAGDFLKCGNSALEEAARHWETTHGYYYFSFRISGGSNVRWGSGR
jgi:hypothetical protein